MWINRKDKGFNILLNFLCNFRIEKIEFLDELEEWNIMQSHYFISLATCYSSTGKENKKYEEINKMIKIN